MNKLWISLFVICCGCVHSGKEKVKAQGEDSVEVLRPIFSEETMANGLRVLWVEDLRLPILNVFLALETGALVDPPDQRGLTNFTTEMLTRGSRQRTASEIAEFFNFYGTNIFAKATEDFVTLGFSGLEQNQKDLTTAFVEVLNNPRFEQKEIERLRAIYLSQMQRLREDPGSFADWEFRKQVFAGAPFAELTSGSEEFLKGVKRRDLVKHFNSFFRPQLAWLIVVGRLNEENKAFFRQQFSTWRANQMKPVPRREFAKQLAENPVQQRKLVNPNLQQAEIRLGFSTITRNHPDFLKLRIASFVLGGAFQSRLNQKIRDDLSLTYSIQSHFMAGYDLGYFTIETSTKNSQVALTVEKTKEVFKNFVQRGMTKQELQQARYLMLAQFPAALETPTDYVVSLLNLRRNGVSESYLTDFGRELHAFTLEEVNAAIKQHWQPARLQQFIYANE